MENSYNGKQKVFSFSNKTYKGVLFNDYIQIQKRGMIRLMQNLLKLLWKYVTQSNEIFFYVELSCPGFTKRKW